jgi:hypothetical protein
MGRQRDISVKAILWSSLVVGLLLSACGYSVHRQSDLPFKEIQIGTIENKTLEPKLQDKLYAALAEEFMKNGIRVVPSAERKISAAVHTFDMTVLAEKNEVAVEYLVVIKADFIFEEKDGQKKPLKNIDSPFIVSLLSSDDLSALLAKKELVEEQALRDVAMRVVGALIYP